jgi:hypothetical protein
VSHALVVLSKVIALVLLSKVLSNVLSKVL